jgi:molybdopterin-guanine dinucleotide biosynthesis protein B
MGMRIFGFAGWSGSGKTTLIERVIPTLTARGLRVSLIKHAHHEFDIDQPGKDSWRHRHAGCSEVLISSSVRFALMHELRGADEPSLRDLLLRLAPCDIALVEGFKRAAIPKLEIYRASLEKPALYPDDPHVIAIATDRPDALPVAPAPGTDVIALEAYDVIATLADRRSIEFAEWR